MDDEKSSNSSNSSKRDGHEQSRQDNISEPKIQVDEASEAPKNNTDAD